MKQTIATKIDYIIYDILDFQKAYHFVGLNNLVIDGTDPAIIWLKVNISKSIETEVPICNGDYIVNMNGEYSVYTPDDFINTFVAVEHENNS